MQEYNLRAPQVRPRMDKIPRLSPEKIHEKEWLSRPEYKEITDGFNLDALKSAIEKVLGSPCRSLVLIAQGE